MEGIVKSHYLFSVFEPEKFPKTVENVCRVLNHIEKVNKTKIETLVCRGVSGITVTSAVAYASKRPFTVVRKEDGSHSCCKIEGLITSSNYVIIDDFIATGDTVRAIVDMMSVQRGGISNDPPQCIGFIRYHPLNASSVKKDCDYYSRVYAEKMKLPKSCIFFSDENTFELQGIE